MADVPDLAAPPQLQHAEALLDRLLALLPDDWRDARWLGLARWQWVALPVFAALVWGATWLLVRFTRVVVTRLTRKRPSLQRALLEQEGPLRLWWSCWLGRGALRLLSLSATATSWWDPALKIGIGVALFWGLLRGLREWTARYITSPASAARPGSAALVNLLSRIGQLMLGAFAVLLALSELGYSVSSVLAGLGIGGIALALGAQKTLENLFGALALTVDQPVREGDYVTADGAVSGVVEKIGLRSTQLRTVERTLVSIPNGKLADMRLENYSQRDRFRFATTVTLVYRTTAAQMEAVLQGFREVLTAEKQLWPDAVVVRFAALGDWSLNVDVEAWFLVGDVNEFRAVRERVLLGFMKVVEQAGTGFAFPTQTVELQK